MLITGGCARTCKTGLVPLSLLDSTHQCSLCCLAHLEVVLPGDLFDFVNFHTCSPLQGILALYSLLAPPETDHVNRIKNQGYLAVAKDGGPCGTVHFAVIGFKTLDHHLVLPQ